MCSVTEEMQPVAGTEEIIECDALVLSVGLIPENELLEKLGVPLDAVTNCPVCGPTGMTQIPGIFCAGNSLKVFDLVDYVTGSGETAGRAACEYAKG
jgi:thioredoxin reductase